SAPNMNLCSKCYRDLRVSAEQAASAKAVTEKTLSFKSNPSPIYQRWFQSMVNDSALWSIGRRWFLSDLVANDGEYRSSSVSVEASSTVVLFAGGFAHYGALLHPLSLNS
ncbi:Zinc finger A20 and AN1 domain-containing stress-associated protein 1, partial [Linum grandiflorum]